MPKVPADSENYNNGEEDYYDYNDDQYGDNEDYTSQNKGTEDDIDKVNIMNWKTMLKMNENGLKLISIGVLGAFTFVSLVQEISYIQFISPSTELMKV